MPLSQRVPSHAPISFIAASLAVLATAGLAGCSGHYAPQKVAASSYPPRAGYDAASRTAVVAPEPAIDRRMGARDEPGGDRDGSADGAGVLPRGIDRPGLGTSWGE